MIQTTWQQHRWHVKIREGTAQRYGAAGAEAAAGKLSIHRAAVPAWANFTIAFQLWINTVSRLLGAKGP